MQLENNSSIMLHKSMLQVQALNKKLAAV